MPQDPRAGFGGPGGSWPRCWATAKRGRSDLARAQAASWGLLNKRTAGCRRELWDAATCFWGPLLSPSGLSAVGVVEEGGQSCMRQVFECVSVPGSGLSAGETLK